jgi:hypothetical protein
MLRKHAVAFQKRPMEGKKYWIYVKAVTVALPSVVSSSHPPRVHADKLAHKTCAKLIEIKSWPSSIAIQHSRPAFVDGAPAMPAAKRNLDHSIA